MYPKLQRFENFTGNYPDKHTIASASYKLGEWLKIMECVCLSDDHPWGLWESNCSEQPLLWEMQFCSFSRICTAHPQFLLPLCTCQVHHDALAAELHRSRPCGQGSDAGGRMPVQGKGGTRSLVPPTLWLPGFLYPRHFNLRSDSTIVLKDKITIAKVIVIQSEGAKWVNNVERKVF